MHGKNVCFHHGGPTPRGHALPQTTTGRYSKDLPTRLGARFLESRADPDLLNLSAEISLIDTRGGDILKRIDSGESGAVWQELKATYKAMQEAQKARDGAEVARLLNDLGGMITRGHADYAAWADLRTLVEQRRKLSETESKRRKDMQDMITTENAMVLVTSLSESVRRNVSDPDQLKAITADLARILNTDAD